MKLLAAIHEYVARRLRLSNPWNYKAPVLIAVTYIHGLQAALPWHAALLAMAASIATIVGIAAFGYATNDLGDRRADLAAGKPNALAGLGTGAMIGLLAAALAVAITPWLLYLPLDGVGAACLGAELLLFVLYIAPPFRLKERGLLGLAADSLYAHALPAFLAAHTFQLMGKEKSPLLTPMLIALVAWQFALGLRNILLHQLKDATHDQRSGLRTLVTRWGEARATRLLAQVLVPLEVATWLTFLVLLAPTTWLPLAAWPVWLIWQAPKADAPRDLRGRLYRYLDDFYIGWLPLLVLATVIAADWRQLGLAAAHLLLFKSAFSPTRDRFFSKFAR